MSTRALYPHRPGPGPDSPAVPLVLDSFVPYKPGGGARPRRRAKLSSNESPVRAAALGRGGHRRGGRQVNRYPDNGAAALTEAIAERLGVPARARRGGLRLGRA